MTHRRIWILAFVLLIGPRLFSQSHWPAPGERNFKGLALARCRSGDRPMSYPVGKYKIKLVPSDQQSGDPEETCDAFLLNPDGSERLLHEDASISILRGTGEDVFGNGHPGVILEGFSGGAHCCFTYIFADLGDTPLVLPEIENQTGFYVFKDPSSGRYRILTWDGAFDYFDDFCHACSPAPIVVLEAYGTGLRDVSGEYVADYDDVIADSKAKIEPEKLNLFAGSSGLSKHDPAWGESEEIRRAILEIVFAYLYSGRENTAWQALDQMWPETDRERIKMLIVTTKAKGILSEINASRGKKSPPAP